MSWLRTPECEEEKKMLKDLSKMSDDWATLAELQAEESQKKKKTVTFQNDGLPKIFMPKSRLYEFIPKEAENAYDPEDFEDGLAAAEASLLKKILRTKLVETTAEVEVKRKSSHSPLFSVKSFEQLKKIIPEDLLSGVYAMGYITPSKIQESSLPTLLANPPVNMIAQAQSGTGKTAAFLIASLSRINTEEAYPQVVVLSPTYELALQTGAVAQRMAQFCPITFRYAIREQTLEKGQKVTEHVVVGTPGKIFDWTRRCRYFDMKKVRVFVLDEADIMISTQGFHDQCIRIHSLLSPDCQMLLFSATYTKEVMDFAEQIITDPVIIRLRREEETLDNIHQYYIRCPSADDRYTALQNIYGSISIGQTMIFCRTKRAAAWLGGKLAKDGHSVGYLSSDLTVQERQAVINSFREGKEKVLITTNVLSRGIDIEQMTLVINFDLPVFVDGGADCETYLHRIGRTGRFGKSGIAVNLVSSERDERLLRDIEEHFDKPILPVDAQNLDELEKLYES